MTANAGSSSSGQQQNIIQAWCPAHPGLVVDPLCSQGDLAPEYPLYPPHLAPHLAAGSYIIGAGKVLAAAPQVRRGKMILMVPPWVLRPMG